MLLLQHEALLLLVLADRPLAQLVELELLEEDVFRDLDWPTQSSPALIEIKDRLKESERLGFNFDSTLRAYLATGKLFFQVLSLKLFLKTHFVTMQRS